MGIVLTGHGSFRLLQHIGDIILEVVGAGLIFEVTPEPLDGVEIGTVGRQPDYHHPMLKQTEGGQSRSAFMIGDIIHHPNNSPGWILLDQQFFQEQDKGCGVFNQRRGPGDRVFRPVIATKDMPLLLFTRTGGRYSFLRSDLHPTSAQRRIEHQGYFVHKDGLEIVSDAFFKRLQQVGRLGFGFFVL